MTNILELVCVSYRSVYMSVCLCVRFVCVLCFTHTHTQTHTHTHTHIYIYIMDFFQLTSSAGMSWICSVTYWYSA